MITTSLLISTFNWPEALDLVLKSVECQTVLPNEVLIADDGSTKETERIIKKYSKRNKILIRHIWQEDKGFRLAEIRNKAISAAKYEYIIQIDGDCILHKEFIKDHVSHATKNIIIGGSRVLLPKRSTEKFLSSQKFNFCFLTSQCKNRFNAMRVILLSILFSRTYMDNRYKKLYSIRGCNMSYWKNDALKVNGYDNKIQGWGREDTDFLARMMNSGIAPKKVKFSCVMYHLYHLENPKGYIDKNTQMLEYSISSRTKSVEDGIIQKNAQK